MLTDLSQLKYLHDTIYFREVQTKKQAEADESNEKLLN